MFHHQSAKTRVTESPPELGPIRIGVAVVLTTDGQHRVRADLHPAVDPPCEMDAEEREPRVRDRVDEPTDKVLRFGHQRVVLTAERHDPHLTSHPGQGRHPIGVETGTVHHHPGPNPMIHRTNVGTVAVMGYGHHLEIGANVGTALARDRGPTGRPQPGNRPPPPPGHEVLRARSPPVRTLESPRHPAGSVPRGRLPSPAAPARPEAPTRTAWWRSRVSRTPRRRPP